MSASALRRAGCSGPSAFGLIVKHRFASGGSRIANDYGAAAQFCATFGPVPKF